MSILTQIFKVDNWKRKTYRIPNIICSYYLTPTCVYKEGQTESMER